MTLKEDTSKVFGLNEIAYEYIFTKPDSATILGEQALQLAKNINYKKGQIQSNVTITGSLFVKGNYYRAIQVLMENLRTAEEIKDMHAISFTQQFIGLLYKDMGDYNTGLEYVLRAKKIDDSLGRVRWDTHRDIGTIYERMDRLDSALKYTQKAYELELIENKGNHAFPPYVLGNIHAKLNNYVLAMAYYHNALERAIKNNIFKDVIDVYNGMTTVFLAKKEPDSAIYYAKEALHYHASVSYTKGAQEAANILARAFRSKGAADSALKYFELSTLLKDSLYSQEKVMQVQNLAFAEQQRLNELNEINKMQEAERKTNLQYAAIALGLIVFIVLFFVLSHSIIANEKLIRFLGILSLLIVFEFINLLVHPYLAKLTHHSAFLMLLIMVCIAALLIPFHHRLEKWITHKLVEKNKRIRLASARRTIAELESNSLNES